MNTDHNHSDHTHSDHDQPLQSVLRELDRDAVSVDHEALERIRELARRELTASAPVRYEAQQTAGPLSRALATLAAAVAVLLIAVSFPAGQAEERPSLGSLLADLDAADSAVLDVRQAGRQTTIQFQRPGTVTWQDDESHYRIADGHQLWRVTSRPDEDPRIEVESSPLPAEGITALRLLNLAQLDLSALDRVTPSTKERWRSVRCDVYEADIRFADQPARLRAFAGVDDGRLKGLRVVDQTSARRVLADINIRTDAAGQIRGAERLRTSLKDDGRIGQLSEVHGLVFVRSFPGHRWTPAAPATPLYVGDQIRCETIGAHAAVVRLSDGTVLTAGPGTQLGLEPDGRLQLQQGDLRVRPAQTAAQTAAPDGLPREVFGPGGESRVVKSETLLRVRDGGVVPLDTVPSWLTTLDANMTSESLGSLVAQVDGRDVSLTMGFHHVTVEIRDQIARTVIEESFVNNTNQRLEGVFHFPLPHDASISGFGMWIGDQLVEADVVEKQRARQIYETILREKRDPGLLEWEGGNIFKARVFPIEPHREKKIRIVYTQTLPLQNGTFRYTYPLRSDLLQKTPLRDLTIDVLLHSEVGVGHLQSPSHPTAVVAATEHAASLHYAAQNVTPQRDFELTCRLARDQPHVVAIPHVRGDDGYFMLQLSPPSVGAGNWSRTLVRDGTPLDLIVLCDTSLSMDPVARSQQADLLAALLGSLSPAGQLRLACCDAEVRWLVREAVSVDDDLRQSLVTSVRERRSLGWSNLKPAFEQAVALAQDNTQIIYIGDATVVADTPAVVNELTSWLAQLADADELVRPRGRGLRSTPVPTVHGIAVGNAFDANVLRAMGRVGRGTSRVVSGTQSPQSVARQLLFEITRPGLKDLQVRFRNVDVAAVYPSALPNLADGMQHIITGRFRPGADDADAEVIVTGRRGEERVEYVARMPLSVPVLSQEESDPLAATADQNSFIPRLWAKAHLDQLLLESPTDEVRQRIVRLSQIYHLMTPYTSLLVLESDADRERFGVEKSQLMRDGEEFFATGREEAEYSLRQQQLAVAKAYRQGLYQQFVQEIERLRAMPIVSVPRDATIQNGRLGALSSYDDWGGFVGGDSGLGVRSSRLRRFDRGQAMHWGLNTEGRSLGENLFFDQTQFFEQSLGYSEGFEDFMGLTETDEFSLAVPISRGGRGLSRGRISAGFELTREYAGKQRLLGLSRNDYGMDGLDVLSRDFGRSWYSRDASGLELEALQGLERSLESVTLNYDFNVQDSVTQYPFYADRWESLSERGKGLAPMAGARGEMLGRGFARPNSGAYYKADENLLFGSWARDGRVRYNGRPTQLPLPEVEPYTFGVQNVNPQAKPRRDAIAWPGSLQELFPAVVHALSAAALAEASSAADVTAESAAPGRDPLSDWPEDVAAALKLLDVSLQSCAEAVKVVRTRTTWHTGSQQELSRERQTMGWAASVGWLLTSEDHRGTLWRWSVGADSGTWLPAFATGRRQKHEHPPEDVVCPIPVPGRGLSFQEAGLWREWSARLEREDSSFRIVLTSRRSPWLQRKIVIDQKKRCVLRYDVVSDGVLMSRMDYQDHVAVGEVWVPQTVTSLVRDEISEQLVRTSSVRYDWLTLPAAKFATELQQTLPDREAGLQLTGVLPSPAAAGEAISSGNARFEHELVRVLQLVQQEQWTDALQQLDDCLQRHYPDRGQWLRWELLRQSDRLVDLAADLPGPTVEALRELPVWEAADDVARVAVVRRLSGLWERCLSEERSQPMLEFVGAQLEECQAAADVQISFQQKRIRWLDAQQQFAAAAQRRQTLAQRWPFRFALAQDIVTAVVSQGTDAEAERAWKKLVNGKRPWTPAEWNTAFLGYLNWLRSVGEFRRGLQVVQQWAERCDHHAAAWSHVLRSHVEVNKADKVRQLRDAWLAYGNDQLANAQQAAQFAAAFEFGLGKLAGLTLAGPQQEVRAAMLQLAAAAAHQDRLFTRAEQVFGDNNFVRQPDGQATLRRVLQAVADQVRNFRTDEGPEPLAYRLQTIFGWLQRSGVSGCDEHNALLEELRELLDRSLAELPPEHLTLLLQTWGCGFDEDTTVDRRTAWQQALQQRWLQTEDQRRRDELAAVMRTFEAAAFDSEHQLAWHRFYASHCRPIRQRQAHEFLFSHLLTMPWDEDREQEMWQLGEQTLPEVREPSEDWTEAQQAGFRRQQRLQRLVARSHMIRRWTAAMLAGRVTARQQADDGWDERNTRQKTVLNRRFQVTALRALLDVLQTRQTAMRAAEAAGAEAAGPEPAAESSALLRNSGQLQLLQLALMKQLLDADVTAGVSEQQQRQLRETVCQQIRTLLSDTPRPTPDPNADRSRDQQLADSVEMISRHWLFVNWLHFAFKQEAEGPAELDRLLAYVRSGQTGDQVAPRAWRAAEFGILIARDEPVALERLLRDWMEEDQPTAPWRRHLGQLLAELDRVEEAVSLYEQAARADRLSIADWKQLAVWQHTLDRRQDKEHSEQQAWRLTSFDDRVNQLRAELTRWKNNTATRTPTAPTDVVRRLREMAASPARSTAIVHVMMEWYLATHDPLVLDGYAQTVLGRTESRLFEMLAHTQGTLGNVDQEAGWDRLYASIARAERSLAETDKSDDQLAMDGLALLLLKLQAAFCGSRQADQPAAHGRLARDVLATLQQRTWSQDTAPWLAQCLANLGSTEDTVLRTRRVQLLESLLDTTPRGSEGRLRIALSLADALRHDGDNEQRRQVLEASLQQHLAHATTWSSHAGRTLTSLVTLQKHFGQYLVADRLLRDCQQARPDEDFSGQIWNLRIEALEQDGNTLAGSGDALYRLLRDSVADGVYRPRRHRQFGEAWTRLLQVLAAGGEAGVAEVRDDVIAARDFLPTLLRRHSHRHQELINTVFNQLAQRVGRREAVLFLVDQLQAEPVALQWTQPRSVWHASGERLFNVTYYYDSGKERYGLATSIAPVRTQVEDALFAGFATGLAARDSKHRALFGSDRISAYRNGRNRIVAALVESARQHANSEPHLEFLLNFHRREWRSHPLVAIQILEAAMEKAELSVSLRLRHIDLLMTSGQYRRAWTLLQPIQQDAPLRQDLRQRSMTCLFHLEQADRLQQEYQFVVTKIIDVPTASWNTLSSFAWHCRTCGLWKEAAGLYELAVDRYGEKRTVDNQLCSMTQQYAECLYQIGQTNQALDQICGSWVYAGQNPGRRNDIRGTLERILQAADLTAAAAHIAQRAAESGEESSFLRRALGKSFVDAGQGAAAVEHLQMAIELRPTDEQARGWLVAAYDQSGQPQAAIDALLDLLEMSPRSITTCRDLAERFAAAGDAVNAERATTSVVESAPVEAAHQIAMAEGRAGEENWSAAIGHWQQAVSLRPEDPAPLLSLTRLQWLHGDRAEARTGLQTLRDTEWDERFQKVDEQIDDLVRLMQR